MSFLLWSHEKSQGYSSRAFAFPTEIQCRAGHPLPVRLSSAFVHHRSCSYVEKVTLWEGQSALCPQFSVTAFLHRPPTRCSTSGCPRLPGQLKRQQGLHLLSAAALLTSCLSVWSELVGCHYKHTNSKKVVSFWTRCWELTLFFLCENKVILLDWEEKQGNTHQLHAHKISI